MAGAMSGGSAFGGTTTALPRMFFPLGASALGTLASGKVFA
jgi:hypothetical protein